MHPRIVIAIFLVVPYFCSCSKEIPIIYEGIIFNIPSSDNLISLMSIAECYIPYVLRKWAMANVQ